jgi:hypothetical protein
MVHRPPSLKKEKSERQFRFLMSGGSPLTANQKEKMVSERRKGTLKIKGKPKKSPKGRKAA